MEMRAGPRLSTAGRARVIQAWPWDWENRPVKDGCRHVWEIVTVDRLFDPNEVVARCVTCHTPRCGYAEDADPCTLRRHHGGAHTHESSEASLPERATTSQNVSPRGQRLKV